MTPGEDIEQMEAADRACWELLGRSVWDCSMEDLDALQAAIVANAASSMFGRVLQDMSDDELDRLAEHLRGDGA